MIVGIGIDIIEIERIAKAYQRWGDGFLRKIYTEEEITYCLSQHDPAPSLAARFAAKEAAFKALSQAGVVVRSWQEIIVLKSETGLPQLSSRVTHDLILHLSLTHSNSSAAALVVAERPT
ncbi:MAG: holo-ACP synthase [bacterium]